MGETITSGSIQISGMVGTFGFSGSDFSVGGGFGVFPVGTCCWPVGPIPIAFGVGGLDFEGPWGNADAEHGSLFLITGPDVMVPGLGVYRGHFDFKGHLCSTTETGMSPEPCIVYLPSLHGSGIVEVTASNEFIGEGGREWVDVSKTYNFTVPEPSLGLLTGAGLMSLVWLRQRNRE